MVNTKWIEIDNTAIYLIKFEDIGILPEWHAVGQIMLRQIHANTVPKWYAYRIGPSVEYQYMIGHFPSKEEAIKSIENRDY